MKNIAATLVASLIASSAVAADMPVRHVGGLSSEANVLAADMAWFRGVAVACSPTDGTNLNRIYWEPRVNAIVAPQQRMAFANVVKSLSAPTFQMMSGPDRALQCDDALDVVEDRFPSFAEAPTATPLCWSYVTDLNRCEGTGDDDILAGLPALLEGH